MTDKLIDLNNILNSNDIENIENIKREYKKSKQFVYIKDTDGFVSKIEKDKITNKQTIITKKEWEDLSGEKYYKETFKHGGKRKGAGRKPKTGVVLKFQVRLSAKEKEFINYAREHNLNYDELMQE